MPLPTSWNLPHYFYDSLTDARIDADIATWLPVTQAYAERYKWRIRTFITPEEVLEYYEYGETIDMVGKKTMHYLSYLSALDTQDTEVQKKLGELEYLGTQLAELTLFVNQEWKELGAEKIRTFAESPLLAAYRNDLIETANSVQYVLEEAVERALTKKSRALGIFGLHEELRSSFTFPWSEWETMNNEEWIMKNEGTVSVIPASWNASEAAWEMSGIQENKLSAVAEANKESDTGLDSRLRGNDGNQTTTKMLTEEEIRAFAKNPNRDIRRKAAESMNSVYLVHQNQITLGNLYTGIVKNWSSSMELRGYETVMSKRNISEQLPNDVVDTLMSEVQKYYPLYQRFLRAKQKHLGVETLYGYDVHAPIFKIEKKVSYDEAMKMVQDMFEGFDSRFGDYAKSMMIEGRVDVFPKAGKRGGAFASYDKWLESFVLLNYTDTVDDSFTLAHELGHAIHGHLAQVQKSPVYDAPLVLAETASIFSESLLMERIQWTLSSEEKLELLNQKLLDVFGSIHRQIMYVSFERRVHEHIHAGGEMTYKELNLWWDEETKKLSGDVVTPILPPEKNYSWSAIPHIFSTPFYCYAYSFGMLVSLALVEKYKREGAAMIDDYVKLLSSGGSVPPVEILQSIGIDVTKPEFYSDAFATIESWLVEFEGKS
jgi:oligoendopeptidase F